MTLTNEHFTKNLNIPFLKKLSDYYLINIDKKFSEDGIYTSHPNYFLTKDFKNFKKINYDFTKQIHYFHNDDFYVLVNDYIINDDEYNYDENYPYSAMYSIYSSDFGSFEKFKSLFYNLPIVKKSNFTSLLENGTPNFYNLFKFSDIIDFAENKLSNIKDITISNKGLFSDENFDYLFINLELSDESYENTYSNFLVFKINKNTGLLEVTELKFNGNSLFNKVENIYYVNNNFIIFLDPYYTDLGEPENNRIFYSNEFYNNISTWNLFNANYYDSDINFIFKKNNKIIFDVRNS